MSTSVHPSSPAQSYIHDTATLEQNYRYVTTLVLLLVSMSVTSLASLVTLSNNTSSSNTTRSTTPPHISVHRDGGCKTTSQNIPFLSPLPTHFLPPEWSRAGLTQQDFLNAQGCAAAFVMYYETFDASNLSTLESAVSMLSTAAKERFYTGGQGAKADLHMQAAWRTALQKQQRKQIARVDRPTLQTLQASAGRFFVQMKVPYQLFQQIDGHVRLASYADTVQLTSISPASPGQAVAWQVTAWTGHN